jgi:hypothetical protein
VHAEQNAIIQAAMHGISIEGATLYCTHQPCILCAKIMINQKYAAEFDVRESNFAGRKNIYKIIFSFIIGLIEYHI